MKKIFEWFKQSNRYKHFLYAIPCGLLFSILFVLGLAVGMEFKDKQYGNIFDYNDIVATVFGGLIGQGLMLLILL